MFTFLSKLSTAKLTRWVAIFKIVVLKNNGQIEQILSLHSYFVISVHKCEKKLWTQSVSIYLLPIAQRADGQRSPGADHTDDGRSKPQKEAKHQVQDAKSNVAICSERRVFFFNTGQERSLQQIIQYCSKLWEFNIFLLEKADSLLGRQRKKGWEMKRSDRNI